MRGLDLTKLKFSFVVSSVSEENKKHLLKLEYFAHISYTTKYQIFGHGSW